MMPSQPNDKESTAMNSFPLIVTISLLLISSFTGCSSQSEYIFQSRTDYFATAAKREIRQNQSPLIRNGLGLALAGGGTKAADFSLGIIQGLAEAGVMDQLDMMSTVSGGGYAGLWYYTRMLSTELTDEVSGNPRTRAQRLLRFFQDCLPYRYAYHYGFTDSSCPKPSTQFDGSSANIPSDPYRYQNYLRGYQDVIMNGTPEHAFNFETTGQDRSQIAFNISLLSLRTLVAAGLNVIPNIVFDWEVSPWDAGFTPSRTAYNDGIIRTFGAEPPNCSTHPSSCGPEQHNLWRGLGDESWVRTNLTFERLGNAYTHQNFPLWIINTTAGEDRIPFDIGDAKPFQQTAFEFTPFGSGSGLFGYSEKRFPNISPMEAAMSSAAFLDSQVKSIPPPIRNIATTIMKVSTLDWGRSYPNPAISTTHAVLHRLLPFPVYFLDGRSGIDQINIHLSDGGQSEDLGAYALINRRAKDIIISDHSFDRGGIMEDVCHLKQGLARDWSGQNLYLFIPGLDKLDAVCDSSLTPRLGYDIFNWEHPILLGCVTSNQQDKACTNNIDGEANYFGRLYLIKPAFPGTQNHHLSQAIALAGKTCRNGVNDLDCRKMVLNGCANIEVGRPYETPEATASTDTSPWRFEQFASCELIAFMMNNAFVDVATNDTDKCPHFPQISTVAMTTNSSPWIYGASRELARYYARQLGWFFKKSGDGQAERATTHEQFLSVVAYQDAHPIKPSNVTIGLLGPTVKAGEIRSCLGLQAN